MQKKKDFFFSLSSASIFYKDTIKRGECKRKKRLFLFIVERKYLLLSEEKAKFYLDFQEKCCIFADRMLHCSNHIKQQKSIVNL